MIKKKGFALAVIVSLMSALISQCVLPERSIAGGPYYFVTSGLPRDGAVFAVGETVPIEGGIVDWLEDIDSERTDTLRFHANGLVVGEANVTLSSGVYSGPASIDWIPEAPGEYYLQISGSRRGNWAISRAARICVIEFSLQPTELGSEFGQYLYTHGYEGECEIPERSPEAAPGPLTFSAISIPSSLTYFPGWWDPVSGGYEFGWGEPPEACRDLDFQSINFIATAGDPHDDIAFVKVDVAYEPYFGLVSSTLVLNLQEGSVLSAKEFSGTYALERFGADVINESFEVNWTAYAIGRSGEILAQDGPNTIPVEPCVVEEMTPLDAPIPAEPPTLVPSEANCPPGTYYAPVTNRCIEIQIPDGGSGSSGGNGGGCNLSAAKCSNQGLSFDSNNCECVPIQ